MPFGTHFRAHTTDVVCVALCLDSLSALGIPQGGVEEEISTLEGTAACTHVPNQQRRQKRDRKPLDSCCLQISCQCTLVRSSTRRILDRPPDSESGMQGRRRGMTKSPSRCSSPVERASRDGSADVDTATAVCPGLAAAVATAARQSSAALQFNFASAEAPLDQVGRSAEGSFLPTTSTLAANAAAHGDAASVWSDVSQRNPVPSATTLSVAGDLHPYHSDYKPRASRTLASSTPHGPGADQTSEGSQAQSVAALTAFNPIVTPTASEAASVAGDGGRGARGLDPSEIWGLPTVDEVPKAPPDYLAAARSDAAPSAAQTGAPEVAVPAPDAAPGRTASQIAAQLMYLPGDASCDPVAPVGANATTSTPDKSYTTTHALEITTTDPGGVSDRDEATALAPSGADSGPARGETTPAEPEEDVTASLAMYEARLEAAKGRSAELTDYLTALQARKDEVWPPNVLLRVDDELVLRVNPAAGGTATSGRWLAA